MYSIHSFTDTQELDPGCRALALHGGRPVQPFVRLMPYRQPNRQRAQGVFFVLYLVTVTVISGQP